MNPKCGYDATSFAPSFKLFEKRSLLSTDVLISAHSPLSVSLRRIFNKNTVIVRDVFFECVKRVIFRVAVRPSSIAKRRHATDCLAGKAILFTQNIRVRLLAACNESALAHKNATQPWRFHTYT